MTTSPDARPLVPDEAVNPMEFFYENVDRWGAAEWFDRLTKAIREQDKALVVLDDVAFETYRMIAASSARTLVREHGHAIRSALVTATCGRAVAIKPLEWERRTDSFWKADPFRHVMRYGIEAHQSEFSWYLGVEFMGRVDTLEAAKAAAQADYESRIRSALVASPVAKLTEAQKRQPMKEFRGHLSGRIYFEVRVGLQWEVWFSYRDRSPDANGVARWKASSARYWRRINAVRAAADMWQAFYDGVRCESDRVSCDLIDRRTEAQSHD